MSDGIIEISSWTELQARKHLKGDYIQQTDRSNGEDGARDMFALLYGMDQAKGEVPSGCEWIAEMAGLAKTLPQWGRLCAASEAKPWACAFATDNVLRAFAEKTWHEQQADREAEQAEKKAEAAKEAVTQAQQEKEKADNEAQQDEGDAEGSDQPDAEAGKGPESPPSGESEGQDSGESEGDQGAGDAPGDAQPGSEPGDVSKAQPGASQGHSSTGQGQEAQQAATAALEAAQAHYAQAKQEAAEKKEAALDAMREKMTERMVQALEESIGEIEETEEALEGFTAGKEPGTERQLDAPVDDIAAWFARNPEFRKISKWAGRMARTGRAKARKRRSRGSTETVDIKSGGIDDIADALPMELLGLVDPELEALLDKGLCEESLQVEKRRGNDPEERGPVVVCLDESGSMSWNGTPRWLWAKAAALAMFQRCAEERRPIAIVRFDRWSTVHSFPRPHKATWPEVLEWLGVQKSGGTCIFSALEAADEFIESQEGFAKADVLLVTDADDNHWENKVEAMSKNGVSTYGVKIGGGKWSERQQEVLEECSNIPERALKPQTRHQEKKVVDKMTDGLGV